MLREGKNKPQHRRKAQLICDKYKNTYPERRTRTRKKILMGKIFEHQRRYVDVEQVYEKILGITGHLRSIN